MTLGQVVTKQIAQMQASSKADEYQPLGVTSAPNLEGHMLAKQCHLHMLSVRTEIDM